MLVSNVTINTYSKIGYLWNAFKNQILQPKADQWNWSATLHTSSNIIYKHDNEVKRDVGELINALLIFAKKFMLKHPQAQ